MKKGKIASLKPWQEELEAGIYYWCACGESKNQPFCDGSHKNTDFTPIKFEVKKKEEVYLCNCKRSLAPPYCDGMHKRIKKD